METVNTMQNENSGISPKLRTYGQLRGWTMQRLTIANGGMTLDLSSPTMDVAKHVTGYYVAGLHEPVKFPFERSDVRQFQYALGRAYAATGGTGLVGTWVDSGIVYAEASEWYEGWEEATRIGRERGELAIWSVGSKKEIRL